jgi:hypothetical protein
VAHEVVDNEADLLGVQAARGCLVHFLGLGLWRRQAGLHQRVRDGVDARRGAAFEGDVLLHDRTS